MSSAFAFFFAAAVAQDYDSDSDTTLNVCITPRACYTVDAHNETEYCVTTPWHITYPKHLRNEIWNPDSNPGTTPLIDPYNCGWSHAFDVSRISVYLGTVYYRTPGNGSFNTPTHIETDTDAAFKILLNLYPGTEIALILLFTIGIPLVIIFLVCLCGCVKSLSGCLSRARKNRASKNAQKAIQKRNKAAENERLKGLQRVASDTTLAYNGTEKMPDSENGSPV